MIEVEWWEFEDHETLASEVAGDIGFIIEKAIETNGKAELALPGGRTPVPILETLAKRDFDWSKVRVFPTNERIVPEGSEHSNYEMLERILGTAGATVEPLIDHAQNWSTKEAGQSADARLAGFSWPVDLVWVGMGEDGSTASIFPNQMDDAINAPKSRRAVGVSPDPMPESAPFDRVTLTRGALLSGHTMIVTLAGPKKREVLEKAIEDGPLSNVPIGRVLAEVEVPVDIYWSAN
ncbi:6-phosphogluconolactonase [Parasphingopyxis algicola]|uniref:6-phosphogluconolactonase n=1 Tax=Parasphingopyxis algicola TaxID=2026624 RepID=UPI0015A4DCBD|nr:6-phosphogluconolactonase [Parasphingopyxis algicola]QLC25979.1 6-phosphogluconolactonase [Parasphingopyxis algicola]